MDLQGQTVLVTGAGGFIGSHVTEALLAQGCHVRAMARYNSRNSQGWLEHLKPDDTARLQVIACDIRDPHAVQGATAGCDIVLHLAALIAIPYSYHAPSSYVQTNVSGTLNLLQAARQHNVKKFVQTSTSEVYGSAQTVPITEDHPLRAQSPYAATKTASDQLALSFHDSFDLPVAVLRPFNTFGPRQSARAVIPTIITQIAAGKTRIQLGATEPTRDFCYATDTAAAFLAAAESDQAVGQVIHTGTGHEISIGDTARLIAKVMNADVQIEADPNRVRPANSEVQHLCADPAKAQSLTTWEPQFAGPAGLKKALALTAEWFTDPNNLAFYNPDEYTI